MITLYYFLYTSVEHPTGQPLAILLEPWLLEDHQASTEGATKVISLVVLVKEVASRQVEPCFCSEEWFSA